MALRHAAAMTDAIISPRQARAARALLDWDQQQVATAAGLSAPTVRRFERGQNELKAETRRKLVEAFRDHGVGIAVHSDQEWVSFMALGDNSC